MSKIIEQCLAIAEKELKQRIIELSKERSRHWSFFVDNKGKIVSWGQNSHKTHPLAKKYGHRFDGQHSELAAYIALPNRLKTYEFIKKCSVYNIRINRYLELRNSMPCCNCQNLLAAIGVQNVYSTQENTNKLYLTKLG